MTTAIYTRVSTEDQAKHGYSLENQIKKCKEKAGTSNVLEYVDDGITGETMQRPALMRMIGDIKNGIIDRVICYDPDRLSRNHTDQMILKDEIVKKNKVKLVFVNGDLTLTGNSNPYDIFIYDVRGAVASLEKAKIRERTMQGRKTKATHGKVIRDYQIYGYDFDSKTCQLLINEQEAKVVKLIFEYFLSPTSPFKGINGIAKHLTDRKVPTKRGASQWHRQVIRQILMNRAYIGELYQNRWDTEGMLLNAYTKDEEDKVRMKERPKEEWILTPCPPIIKKEEFYFAEKLLQTIRRRYAGKSKNEYLLSGLLRCGECGNTLTGRKAKNWGKFVFEYTDRKNTAGAKNKGCGTTVKCEDIDQKVWEMIHNWLQAPGELSATLEPEQITVSFEQMELDRIVSELEKLKRNKTNLVGEIAKETDEDIKELYREELKKIIENEKELKQQMSKIEQQLEEVQQAGFDLEALDNAVEYYATLNPDELTWEQKRELVRMVIKEIRVYKNGDVELINF